MNLFFWNLKQNDNSSLIARALRELDVDVAAFAECGGVNFEALCCDGLNGLYKLVDPVDGPGKVRLLVRRDFVFSGVLGYGRYLITTISNDEMATNIAVVHLQDRRNDPEGEARRLEMQSLVSDLRSQERDQGCLASIVLGDFNTQPFEMEMISPGNLNATLFKDVAIRMRSRRVSGRDYPFMYNPTLEFLSEANNNCGSYYSAAGPATFYWYCLDQAVFSPLLADKVAEYRYLRQIGDVTLMKDVAPNGEISDHLPLFVRIDWSMGNER